MWTTANRTKYNRDKLRYPSYLTDDVWSHIDLLIPPAKRCGWKRSVDPLPWLIARVRHFPTFTESSHLVDRL
jgi:hypothetical protein